MRLPDATDQIRLAPVRALRAVFSGVGQLLLAADRLREEDARQAQESGEGQPGTLASWDGRLSSSVRLISPTGMPVSSSPGAESAPDGKSERAADGKTGKTGRKGTGRAADAPGKATKPAPRGRPARADAQGVTGTKAGNGNAGSGRRSTRLRSVKEPSRFRSLDLTGNVRMLTDEDVADLAGNQIERSPADAEALGPAGPTSSPGLLAGGTGTPSWSDTAPSLSSWATGTARTPEISSPLAELPISGYDDLSLPSLRARLRNLGAAEVLNLLAHERSHANREDVVTMFERRIAKLADGT